MIAPAASTLADREFKLIRDAVHQYCGIALGDEKVALVRARIARHMRGGGYRSVGEYLGQVLADRGGEAFAGFIDAISTHLTGFFRERQHFDYLSSTFLPALLAAKRRAGDRRVLAWSAACSSGEEAYSLAMTLLDAAGPSHPWDFRLLATDLSAAQLAAARAGVYPESRLAAVPEVQRERYFVPAGALAGEPAMKVSPELLGIVRVRQLNLIAAWPFAGPFDFIFCRNVMIYFDTPTQQKLVERFWHCLRPGGLLFTGHSESLTRIAHRFVYRQASIYEKDSA